MSNQMTNVIVEICRRDDFRLNELECKYNVAITLVFPAFEDEEYGAEIVGTKENLKTFLIDHYDSESDAADIHPEIFE